MAGNTAPHRLSRFEPEHLERLYAKMQRSSLAAGTAHHVHRTVRYALTEAVRRRHLAQNPALLAKAPKLADDEPEPHEHGPYETANETSRDAEPGRERWRLGIMPSQRGGG